MGGGMTEYIRSGMAKLKIEECATKKQARIDSNEDVIIGINKYILDESASTQKDSRMIDNASVREQQISQIEKIKSKRDESEVTYVLSRLEESARIRDDISTSKGNHPQNLL